MTGTSSLAQSTDSLMLRERLLLRENDRYIRMAQLDGVLSATQADSLRKISSGIAEKPLQVGIDLLMQIRDYIDSGYDEMMRIVDEPLVEEYYYSANRMLPSVLKIPDDFVSPEEREAEHQRIAMEQMAESMARDFEKEKIPEWQIWLHRFFPIFFGDPSRLKGESTYFNGQSVPVPARR